MRMDDRGVITPCPACGKQNRIGFDRVDQTARCEIGRAHV